MTLPTAAQLMLKEYQAYYADLRARVDARLETSFDDVSIPESLRQAVQYSLMAPGKRLRPVLVLMAVDVCGAPIDDGLSAACAVEMVHTYSLIHDDLPAMDDDALRRGRPTSHMVYGEALAILAGDALLTHAFASLAAQGLKPDVTAECLKILSAAAGGAGMVGGQILDLEAERGPFPGIEMTDIPKKSVSDRSLAGSTTVGKLGGPAEQATEHSSIAASDDVERLMQIHRLKTGALIVASLQLGAAVAQAPADMRQRLRQYGECCGLAFQIADDLLDVTGNDSKLGKETGRDRELGKLTYPALLGVEGSRIKATELVEEACDCLTIFEDRAVPLRQLAQFIVERDH